VAAPDTGREPIGTLRPLGPTTGPGSAEPTRREVARTDRGESTGRSDTPARDRSERRERRERGERETPRRSTTRRDARRDAQRLDVPREGRRLLRRPHFEDDAFGRFAERFARFMGTARFLLYMTAFVVAWILYNWLSPGAFDPFPFIFLTLMLSLQASYAAPLILLAQNRQEDRDRVIGEHDRMANSRAHADMEFLAREMASVRMALGEVATRDYVRSELRALLQELDDRAREDDDEHDDARSDDGPERPHRETDDTRR
jgi:uncharacterized membrane protein